MGSLQLRLFLSYLFIIVVTLGLFGLSLFLLLGGYRDDITYATLEDVVGLVEAQANAEASEIEALTAPDEASEEGEVAGEAGTSPGAGEVQEPVINELLLALRTFLANESTVDHTTSVAFVDREGNVLGYASSRNLDEGTVGSISVPEDPLTAVRRTDRCELKVPEGGTLLCVSMPLSPRIRAAFPETPAVAMVVARPAASLGSVLDDLLPRLWFSGLFGVTAALLLAAVLSQSIGAPLRNIARAARSVARGNYRQRVPATGPPEVRNLAADFNHMTGEVEQSQDTLRAFLMNISHELKTPLTSIRGFSEAMLDGTIDDPEGIERSLRVVNNESNRVLKLVAELLELSRIETGQISMRIEEMEISELLTHVEEVFALRGEETGVALRVEPNGVPRVRGDFERLEQVMNNLLDNAFRHTPDGGQIDVRAAETTAGTVSVMVHNWGPPIPPQDLPRLFDRFFRAERAAAKGKGYGLGLSISREIVKAHGGEIWATSTKEDGTTFAFTLPQASRGRRGRKRLL